MWPKALATGKPALHRTAAEVDALFADHTRRVSLDDVLTALGQPDAFTSQALYSATRGTTEPQRKGGTIRFILRDGSVLLVRHGDFHVIYEAIRYDQRAEGRFSTSDAMHLTNRWRQPLAALLSRVDFMREFPMFASSLPPAAPQLHRVRPTARSMRVSLKNRN